MSEETKESLESAAPEAPDMVSEQKTEEGTDALADQLSEQMGIGVEGDTGEESPGAAEETVLEEEQVKDEIDIQIDLLKDLDWVVRREAVITLGEMGDERCVAPVLQGLRDGDWQVREVSIEACGNIGPPAVEGLLRFLRHWDFRKDAIRALGKIKDERVLDPLIALLRNDEFHEDAREALVEVGQPAVEKLLEALEDKDDMARTQAIIALGRTQDSSALDALIERLEEKDWFARLNAAAAIEEIHDERGREALKPLLKDPDIVVQMRVERILAGWKKHPAASNPAGIA